MSVRDVSRDQEFFERGLSSGHSCRHLGAAGVETVELWRSVLNPTVPPHSPALPPERISAIPGSAAALMDEQFVGSPVLFQQLITARRCAQAQRLIAIIPVGFLPVIDHIHLPLHYLSRS
ncbi:hypothetical protein QR680_012184 [Steinernema hermaphroditum]|uniref:Uncharacterized protein n=1 Tax=Steinernema hermaphroditum TaxID=289476 RepID=A0AA39I3P7_9BILA|nr:hypothetical protein QR680_012184 [Steinernema hermaphroditum]